MKFRHPSHYKKAIEIIGSYGFDKPFNIFLGFIFQKNKNWGSKDRKSYRELTYLILKNYPLFLNKEINEQVCLLQDLDNGNVPKCIAPYAQFETLISDQIDPNKIAPWFHPNPPIFYLGWNSVRDAHNKYENPFTFVKELENQTTLDKEIESGEGIVQDISSTQVVLKWKNYFINKNVWDCCAGAGGKAMVIQKLFTPKRLICSDLRPNILDNLKLRFEKNRIPLPDIECINLELPINTRHGFIDQTEVVIVDVPCSGSGTWRRNPENLLSFELSSLKSYTDRQSKILEQLASITHIKFIIYCTCSLFKDENENMVQRFIKKEKSFRLISDAYMGSYEGKQKGDFLYTALLERIEA